MKQTRALDAYIEQKHTDCNIPPKVKLEKYKISNYFFESIHSDFLCPIRGKMILTMVDMYFKWSEAFLMNSID